jgi:hypothetical protein
MDNITNHMEDSPIGSVMVEAADIQDLPAGEGSKKNCINRVK